jgi:hypothetical protein
MFCRQPIALRPKLASLVLSRGGARVVASQSGVVILQCRTCGKEAPYPVREIVPFDSAPEPRSAFGVPRYRRAIEGG